MTSDGGNKAEQNLALKVMRLTRPCLALNGTTSPFAGTATSGKDSLQNVIDSMETSPSFSSSLVLPQSFG